jgi:hypothetical protein
MEGIPMQRLLARRLLLATALLFTSAFGLRLAFYLTSAPSPGTVLVEMDFAARSLLHKGTIADVYGSGTGPSAHLAPAYPLLQAGLYAVFGLFSPAAHVVRTLLQLAVLALAVTLVPRLAARTGISPGAGWLAAGALALWPLNLFWETASVWEHVWAGTALLLLALGLATLAERGWQDRRLTVRLGLGLGTAALLTPLVLAALAGTLAGGLLSGPRRQVLRSGLWIVPLAGLVLLPWAVRNHVELGEAVLTRSNFPLELYIGNHDRANGYTFGTCPRDPNGFYVRMHPHACAAERQRVRDLGELAYMREKKAQATDWIAAHPGRFLELTATRFVMYWFPPPLLWDPPTGPATWAKALAYAAVGLGGFVGLGLLFVRRHPHRWLYAAFLLGPSLPYLVTHVDLRYRYPTFWVSMILTCEVVAVTARWAAARLRPPVAVGRSSKAVWESGEPLAILQKGTLLNFRGTEHENSPA